MKANRATPIRLRGFTLVELLVVIAIIAMLVTAMLPAVQAMRASARRTQCKNQLLQQVLAVQNYEMSHERFPAGVTDTVAGPIRSREEAMHQSWIVAMLPYLDEGNVHRRVDFAASVYADENKPVRNMTLRQLQCPADANTLSALAAPGSSYAACHDGRETPIDSTNNGVFFLNSKIGIDDVRDGLSQTIFLGEKISSPDDLGWMSGTRATLRNTGATLNEYFGPRQIVRESNDPLEPTYSGYYGYGRGNGGYDSYDSGYDEDEDEDSLEDEQDSEEATDESEADEEDPFGVQQQPDNAIDPDTEEEEEEEEEATEDGEAEVEANEDEEEDAKKTPLVARPPRTDLTVGGFGSKHPSGAHVAFGDGRIQYVTTDMDRRVYMLLGDRDDGALLDPADYRE